MVRIMPLVGPFYVFDTKFARTHTHTYIYIYMEGKPQNWYPFLGDQ
jgi:hypothetical protein